MKKGSLTGTGNDRETEAGGKREGGQREPYSKGTKKKADPQVPTEKKETEVLQVIMEKKTKEGLELF